MDKLIVKCPNCGKEIEIATSKVAISAITATPGAGTSIELTASTKKSNKAEAKINALRKVGVNVDNLFAIRNIKGDYEVGRFNNGEFETVPDNDPIYAAIKEGKTIPDRRLFRRWVMAQVFHMMTQIDYKTKKPIGFTAALNAKGYKYQWKMVVKELRVQAKLAENDPENYHERNRWFNKAVVENMAHDYLKQVIYIVEGLKVKKCKGQPYVRLDHTNIFVDDLQAKVYTPLNKVLNGIKKANSPMELYKATEVFFKEVQEICLLKDMKQSRSFKDAYKGAGAFFTLKNLILFHDSVFPSMDKNASLAYLHHLVKTDECEGFQLLAILKAFLKENEIDIEAKQAEWRIKNANRND